jgi:hypothetical protein
MSSTRATKSGFGREMQQKLNAKYDSDLARQCLVWVREVINSSLGPSTTDVPVEFSTDGSPANFSRVLHDGTVLATLANCLAAGSVLTSRYANPPKLTFKQMELIEMFVRKAKEFGVPDHEAFQTVDLYEDQNLHQVVICLQSLGRKAKSKGLMGFGPKEAEANPRAFTQEKLKSGDNIIGLQMGTNKGASQSGMNFGKNRMILD